MDIVDPQTRSRMMSAIRGKNTSPELMVRRFLHAAGFRFRLHRKDLPGRPDLVLTKYGLVIFVHGCFWHRHSGCAYATFPKTRPEFWETKFFRNIERDRKQYELLNEEGWRVLIIWECGTRQLRNRMDDIVPLVMSSCRFSEWPALPPKPKSIDAP